MRLFRYSATAMCIVLMTGCASMPPMPQMKHADNQQPQAVSSNRSRIVFMRSSNIGSVFNPSLYDVTQEEPVFIGILPNWGRLVYDTTPGEHTFMVVSEAADFMKANMNAGKTYYSIATPRFGVSVARFSLAPIRNDGTTPGNTDPTRIEDMKTRTKLLSNTDETKEWFKNNVGDIKAKQAKYWRNWQQKSLSELADVTLEPQDGE